ncbi:MAG: hypothetical protein Q9195_005546 [Heterodermia aff. obscurata]
MSPVSSPTSLSGHWQPHLNLKHLYYGPGCVEQHLLRTLPTPCSKAFIITGTSLFTKTPLVSQLETLLGPHHAGTVTGIRQHNPLADIERATAQILRNPDNIDTIISLGGGSPIDTAKVLCLRIGERLTHLTIPTTLSAAECTAGGGYTDPNGVKVGHRAPEMGVSAIFYDPRYARYTPKHLWLSTGIRALDHAVEAMYHPCAAEVPWKALALFAVAELFECLPKARDAHPDDEVVMTRLMLAAYASSGLKGEELGAGMGLSHALGHALGAPYGIPHGVTSCLTLGKVVRLKAGEAGGNAREIARLLGGMGGSSGGDDLGDALEVGDRIIRLVGSLGLDLGGLARRGVGREEVPVIVGRALRGVEGGVLYDRVVELVQTLF